VAGVFDSNKQEVKTCSPRVRCSVVSVALRAAAVCFLFFFERVAVVLLLLLPGTVESGKCGEKGEKAQAGRREARCAQKMAGNGYLVAEVSYTSSSMFRGISIGYHF
jgi:hypothetical protein